eukprot:ANDGO_07512.mRNA.1 tubulin-tyrosine ligase family protein
MSFAILGSVQDKENVQLMETTTAMMDDFIVTKKGKSTSSVGGGDEPLVQSSAMDLQKAFEKFRQERIQLRAVKEKSVAMRKERTPEWMQQLREKFIAQAKKYIGIPYHPRYHSSPDSQFHNAPLYLDCCGLIRRVVWDLRDEFGFSLGRWNQAYQLDTLPVKIDEAKDMKPGDLVFYSGTYYNEKLKPQIHDCVHVEIFLGGETGEQTIGARSQTGAIQIHNSYKFESKNYHSIKFHFRSLETWLAGICNSCCEEHSWARVIVQPSKKSIFSISDADAYAAEYQSAQDADQI